MSRVARVVHARWACAPQMCYDMPSTDIGQERGFHADTGYRRLDSAADTGRVSRRAHRRRTRIPRQGRRNADASAGGDRRGADDDRLALRLRRTGRPLARRRADRERHRLHRSRGDHGPAAFRPRPHDGGGHLGRRRHRHGHRRRALCGRHRGDGPVADRPRGVRLDLPRPPQRHRRRRRRRAGARRPRAARRQQ